MTFKCRACSEAEKYSVPTNCGTNLVFCYVTVYHEMTLLWNVIARLYSPYFIKDIC